MENAENNVKLIPKNAIEYPCISLIGMAGCGKSTTAIALGRDLGWPVVDSDCLLEALYAARLQDITDALGKEQFLDLECAMVCAIKARRVVIATGGSVIYKKPAVDHLLGLGPVIWLKVPLDIIEERIARNPERGLAIAPGQTIADIHNERQELYKNAATHICDASDMSPSQICGWVREIMPEMFS